MSAEPQAVTIVMIEDDEGHARLIEKNIRRAGVNNEIVPFKDGTSALEFMLGSDGSGEASARRHHGKVVEVRVGGSAVKVAEGWITPPSA